MHYLSVSERRFLLLFPVSLRSVSASTQATHTGGRIADRGTLSFQQSKAEPKSNSYAIKPVFVVITTITITITGRFRASCRSIARGMIYRRHRVRDR